MDLLLRQWKDSDLEPFIAMNADPKVMGYFPSLLSRDESSASFQRLRRAIDQRGWGVWAVEVDSAFAGFCGLNIPSFQRLADAVDPLAHRRPVPETPERT